MAAKCTGFNYCLWSKPYGKLEVEKAKNRLIFFIDEALSLSSASIHFILFQYQSSGSPNAAMVLHYLHESCESEVSARRKTTSKIQPPGSTLHYTNLGIFTYFQTTFTQFFIKITNLHHLTSNSQTPTS